MRANNTSNSCRKQEGITRQLTVPYSPQQNGVVERQNRMTPYEALKGRKPRMDHLRVFGCVVHVKVPSIQLRKLDKRSQPMSWSWEEEESDSNEPMESEFLIQNQQDRSAREETSNNPGMTEPNNPQSPTHTAPRSPIQSGPSSDTEEEENWEDFSTPNVGIEGC
ncbi:hypothetical protein E3N88_34691 [Mikania micrantha]|uniref:Integrase catalytic domain-containing protein n=1 Tax=Mikania micrantha TaxID=192012 RepID=A0A5N6LZ36_9ASTR|nr:hypothetical protein E3N88_34691 [Mikania micrantha]